MRLKYIVNWHRPGPTKFVHNFRTFRYFWGILGGFFIISRRKKIGRPNLANLPPYHVLFLSHHDLPTYLPPYSKSDVINGRSQTLCIIKIHKFLISRIEQFKSDLGIPLRKWGWIIEHDPFSCQRNTYLARAQVID